MSDIKPEEISHPPMDQLQGFEYCIDSNPSWGEAFALGFQHYILALGTSVMIPTFLVPLMGSSDSTGAYMAAARLASATPPPAHVLSRGIGWQVKKSLELVVLKIFYQTQPRRCDWSLEWSGGGGGNRQGGVVVVVAELGGYGGMEQLQHQ